MNNRIRALLLLITLVIAATLCTGCMKPPESTRSPEASHAEDGSNQHARDYYTGYWLCCGYENNGTVVSFDDLTAEQRDSFPYIILELGENEIGDIYIAESGGYPLNASEGEWGVTSAGIKVDEVARGGSEIIDFEQDGDRLTLRGEALEAFERSAQIARVWLGNENNVPQPSATLYFEKQVFGSQLYVNTIEFDGLSIDVPSDVTYLYDGIKREGENFVTANSYRREGPTLSLFSSPTDAQDIIELAGDNYYGHEDEFLEYGGITYSVFHHESEDLCSTFLQFVVNGTRYSIDFSYNRARELVDYSDYAEHLYATISITGSGDSAESSETLPSGAIAWQEAARHVGETVAVYGPVADMEYASTSNGQPTFIDLGAAYPDSSRVTMVIWGEDRGNFPESPEALYAGKTLCVTGEVYLYRGICNIEVNDPSQVQVL